MQPHALSVSSVAADPAAPHAAACLNCGTALHDQFCARCGQPATTHRITLGHLLHDIPHSVWHVDRGLPYTVREVLLRPGATIRRYLAGQRVDYFRPFALVLLLAGIMAFLMLSLNIQLTQVRPAGVPDQVARQMAEVNRFIFKYFAWFTVAMLPGFALLSWALLRRLRYNLAEHLVANALVLGGVLVIQLLFVPALAWASGTPAFGTVYLLDSFLMPVFQVWAFTQLATGPYRWAGALWRSVLYAFVGLVVNGLLISWVAGTMIGLRH